MAASVSASVSAPPRTCCVSAPGKVLLSGGYLVLEQPNGGIVLSTTARFYSTIQAGEKLTSIPLIRVISPQFHTTMIFEWVKHSYELKAAEHQSRNPYIEASLKYTLCVIEKIRGNIESIDVTLQADNDFYSQVHHLTTRGLSVTRHDLSKLPSCLPCPVDESGSVVVAKTGMGSSAALITSVVGGLLQFFQVCCVARQDDLDLVHHIAQLCHSAAQDKIGSGFDVAAAVFGSHVYTRFSPSILKPLLDTTVPIESLIRHLRSDWDERVEPFKLPGTLELIMGDVCQGSQTVSMVQRVLAWKAAGSERSKALWAQLARQNQVVQECFAELKRIEEQTSRESFEAKLLQLSTQTAAEAWRPEVNCAVCDGLQKLRSSFCAMRRTYRQIGTDAQVEIEPKSQTMLADATMQLPGVILSGVPGAGGRDAIVAIVTHRSVLDRVAEFWETRSPTICPLLLTSDLAGITAEKKKDQYL